MSSAFPIFLFVGLLVALAAALLVIGQILNPRRPGRVKRMPYESGMDPVHDTRRRFDVRFHLLAIAFLVFDVELLFLYPWAVALRPDQASLPQAKTSVMSSDTASPESERQTANSVRNGGSSGQQTASTSTVASSAEVRPAVRPVFLGGMIFLALLTLGFVYDWRKGVFLWR